MSAYNDVSLLLDEADSYGEEQVIRDVARRAGVLWTCANPNCRLDNTGQSMNCEYCHWNRHNPDLFPGEWRCVCMAVNVGPTCRSCRRSRIVFAGHSFTHDP